MIIAKRIAESGIRIQIRIMFICVVPSALKKGAGPVTGVADDLGCALGHRILTIGEEPRKGEVRYYEIHIGGQEYCCICPIDRRG